MKGFRGGFASALGLVFACAAASSLAIAAGEAGDAASAPNVFAHRYALDLNGQAAYYTLALPDVIYAASQRGDLGDVRVFNGAGEPVPYALDMPLDPSLAGTPVPTTLHSVKWFALPASAAQAPSVPLGVTIGSDGSLRASPAATRAAGRQLDLVDLGSGDGPAVALQVHLRNDTYQGRVGVDASDDLQNWQPLPDGQLLKASHAGDTIAQERIALDGLRLRYLRLRWLDDAPDIASIDVEVLPSDAAAKGKATDAAASRQWHEGIVAQAGSAVGEYHFDTGGAYPVDRLRFSLPQPNTVVRATVYSRPNAQASWHEVSDTTLYRLQGKAGEQSNAPLDFAPDADREWRVAVDMRNGGLGSGALTVAIGWRPASLTFVARGAGPFTLSVGNAALLPAAAKREDIVIGKTANIATARIGGALAPLPPAAAAPVDDHDATRRYVLWAALVLAVGSLAAIAWRLARGTRT
ncbi:DUF3999 domain-containing protein [Paraburkholderia flava]|uniref:DUF3999 domain-containing protein n=1 Tax=Paraburkholderia flava TaxID=2547393 RepID=UPI00105C2678|nr:DUF3999 domain-containing protein [Paraburkholderia flava]